MGVLGNCWESVKMGSYKGRTSPYPFFKVSTPRDLGFPSPFPSCPEWFIHNNEFCSLQWRGGPRGARGAGRVPPLTLLTAKNLPKIGETREKIGKNREKRGKIRKKRQKSGRFFHFAPLDRYGWLRYCPHPFVGYSGSHGQHNSWSTVGPTNRRKWNICKWNLGISIYINWGVDLIAIFFSRGG